MLLDLWEELLTNGESGLLAECLTACADEMRTMLAHAAPPPRSLALIGSVTERDGELTVSGLEGCRVGENSKPTLDSLLSEEGCVDGEGAQLRLVADVPEGAVDARSFELVGGGGNSHQGLWRRVDAKLCATVHVTCHVKFVGEKPLRSDNFGLKHHEPSEVVDDEWIDGCKADEWKHIELKYTAGHAGDNTLSFILDSCPKDTRVRLCDLCVTIEDAPLGTRLARLAGRLAAACEAGTKAVQKAKVFSTEDMRVVVDALEGTKLVGNEMNGAGRDKWLTSVTAHDGCVYGVPGDATRVFKFDPQTEISSEIGPDLSTYGRFAWHSAVLAPNGRIYAAPFNSKMILRIDPKSATVDMIDPQIMNDTRACYLYGSLGADGLIYFAPCKASHVLRLDPNTETTSFIGPDLGSGKSHKYMSCATAPNGCIYALPAQASKILKIDPKSDSATLIGPDFGSKEWKWAGAVAAEDGIYGVPHYGSKKVVYINTANDTVELIGKDLGERAGYVDAALGVDGCIYSVHERVLRIDPSTKSVELTNDRYTYHGWNTFWGVGCNDDGNVYCVPRRGNRVLRIGPRTAYRARCLLDRPIALRVAAASDQRRSALLDFFNELLAEGEAALHAELCSACSDALPIALMLAKQPEKDDSTHGPCSSTMTAVLAAHSLLAHPDALRFSLGSSCLHLRLLSLLANLAKSRDDVAAAGGMVAFNLQDDSKLIPKLLAFCPSPVTLGQLLLAALTSADTAPAAPFLIDAGADLTLANADGETALHLAIKRHDADLAKSLILKGADVSAVDRDDATPHKRAREQRMDATIALLEGSIELANEKLFDDLIDAALLECQKELRWPVVLAYSSPGYEDQLTSPNNLPAAKPLVKVCSHKFGIGPSHWRPAAEEAWQARVYERVAPLAQRVLGAALDSARACEPTQGVLLREYNEQRRGSLKLYSDNLSRARRDVTYPEFERKAMALGVSIKPRKPLCIQRVSKLTDLTEQGAKMQNRFEGLLAILAARTRARVMQAPLKGLWRSFEKLLLRPNPSLDCSALCDPLRGALLGDDFNVLTFALEMLTYLDVELGDADKCGGIDLEMYQIRLLRIKDRFAKPTSGGWADALLNFTFVNDPGQHICELQLQHAALLVVRSEGKAHNAYNSFRSAFEVLESIGKAPQVEYEDSANERHEQPADGGMSAAALQKLLERVERLESSVDELKGKNEALEAKNEALEAKNEALATELKKEKALEAKTEILEVKNDALRLEVKLEAESKALGTRMAALELVNAQGEKTMAQMHGEVLQELQEERRRMQAQARELRTMQLYQLGQAPLPSVQRSLEVLEQEPLPVQRNYGAVHPPTPLPPMSGPPMGGNPHNRLPSAGDGCVGGVRVIRR